MFMYMFHIAFGIGLMALVMGLSMMKCCCNKGACEANGGKCCKCGKLLGLIITILAVISLGCLVNTGYKQMNGGMMDMSKEELHKMKSMMKDMKKEMKQDAGMNEPAAE